MTKLPSLTSLPDAFAIKIDNYSAISLSGEEQSKYLQGQVTCDVNKLADSKLLTGAHCNAKGKVFSVFRLFDYQNSHLLFQPKATIAASIAELKKFGVFAKVDITETEQLSFYIIAGNKVNNTIQQYFGQLPDSLTPVVTKGDAQIVYLAGQLEHFLFIAPHVNAEKLIASSQLPVYPGDVWQLLEIVEGFPTLSAHSVDHYVPQMLNLQAIHGISFTKGCYLGQETVARMQYLGKNKRALFYLTGTATKTVTSDDILELQLGDNWRKAGDIIAYYQADNGEISLQAVLNNDIERDTKLRIKQDEQSSFTIASLPYSLNEKSD